MKRSQVTTKRGDTGESVTLGGDVYSKAHPLLECTGSVDTLRAHVALCRLLVLDLQREDANTLADFLLWLLHTLFLVGTHCNDPENKRPDLHHAPLDETHLAKMEAFQAHIERQTPLPPRFIACAATPTAAQIDIACTAARTLERNIVRLQEAIPAFDTRVILPFINRSSDTLYMLARHLEDGLHTTVDYNMLERDFL